MNGYDNSVDIYVLNSQAQFSHNFKVQSGFRAQRVMVKDDHLFVPGISLASPSCDTELADYVKVGVNVVVCKRDGTLIGYIS